MIVYRPTRPKRRPEKAAKAVITGPVVVSRPAGRYRQQPERPRDPEVEAGIAAFFARMGLTWKPAE